MRKGTEVTLAVILIIFVVAVIILVVNNSPSKLINKPEEEKTTTKFELIDSHYIGDDINDIELLSEVGFAACPADVCAEVKAVAGIQVMQRKGGEGCVREVVDNIA